MSATGGIFWGVVTPELLKKLAQWSDVVLNDSQINGPENPVAQPIDAIRSAWAPAGIAPKRFWASVNCLSVFVDANGRPSVYWPQQGRLWAAAEAFGAWLVNQNTGLPIEAGTPRVRFFDLTNRPFAQILAAEMAYSARQVDGLFLDEAHNTLGFMRQLGPFRPSDEEWGKALAYVLRRYSLAMNGNPKPVVTNGTFGRADSALVSGRFWQACGLGDAEHIMDDAEGAAFTMVHSCSGMMTETQLAVLAAGCPSKEACCQWTIHNGAFDAANVFPTEVTA